MKNKNGLKKCNLTYKKKTKEQKPFAINFFFLMCVFETFNRNTQIEYYKKKIYYAIEKLFVLS